MYRRPQFALVLALACLLSPHSSFAKEFTQPLWPDGVPDANASAEAETVTNRGHEQNALGFNRSISHVNEPTLTVILPHKSRATGAAVLIFPGGAFSRIVIDKEGLDVGRWLVKQGIAAIVVKYRTGHYNDPRQVADAHQTLRIVREHAKEWGIDPERVGAMGFSAGGYIAAALCKQASESNANDDGAMQQAHNMPAFLAGIYSIYPNDIDDSTVDFPPTFMLYANDDDPDVVENNTRLMQHLHAANVVFEVHAHALGGHGFGLGVRGGSVADWPKAFMRWLQEIEIHAGHTTHE